jgi:hypothetical protein
MRSNWRWVVALTPALFYAFGLYGLTNLAFPRSGMAVLSFLLGAPAVSCVIASVICDRRGEWSAWGHAKFSALIITLMLVAGAVVLREGSICLAMAAPIFYGVGMIAGAVTGAVLRSGRNGPKVLPAVALLPLLAMPLEHQIAYPQATGSVVTKVVINAPPAAIWRNTVDIPAIQPSELRPTFSHTILGVPEPIEARLKGSGPGAVRDMKWRRGLHFQEQITTWQEGQLLGWRFHFSPDSIPLAFERHINLDGDYLKLVSGDYRLTPLGDGRTQLTLTTRYWIRTPVNLYCHGWAHIFLNDIQGAVLRVIKSRAEAPAAAPRSSPSLAPKPATV